MLAATVWCQFNFSALSKVCYENEYSSVLVHLTHNSRCHLPSATSTLPVCLTLSLFNNFIARGTCNRLRVLPAATLGCDFKGQPDSHMANVPHHAASHDLIFKIEKSASAKPKGHSIKLGFNTRQGGHTEGGGKGDREGCMGRLNKSSILLGCESN